MIKGRLSLACCLLCSSNMDEDECHGWQATAAGGDIRQGHVRRPGVRRGAGPRAVPRLRRPRPAGVEDRQDQGSSRTGVAGCRPATPGAGGGVTADTRVRELAEVWLGAAEEWSTGAARAYKSMVKTQSGPSLGDLRLREVSPGVVNRALVAISERSGHGAAKSTRSALWGMFRLAVRDGAVPTNPVRDSGAKLRSTATKSPRASTADETGHLTGLLRGHPRAVELDLLDLVDWMLATGCRIGEALATRVGPDRDGRPLLDLGPGRGRSTRR
jgi:hypothetical protein